MAQSPVLTLRKFFGLREDTGLADFAKELKALSDEEKNLLAEGIENETFDY